MLVRCFLGVLGRRAEQDATDLVGGESGYCFEGLDPELEELPMGSPGEMELEELEDEDEEYGWRRLNRQEKTRVRNPGFSQPQHREILNSYWRMLEQMQ